MGKFKNLTGTIRGRLIVTDKYKIENKKTFWLCNCSCGGEKWIRADHITLEKVNSCGLCEGNECIGKKFGKLTILKRLEKEEGQKQYKFLCECECGNFHTSTLGHLKDGHVNSCSNCNRIYSKHEFHRKIYKRWYDMISRCEKETDKSFKNYGGRGIKVCNEWKDYITFRDWCLKNGFKEELELDRINVDGNYCPENCRFVTKKENANNTTRNIVIDGLTLSEIAQKYNMNYKMLWARQNTHKKKYNKIISLEDLVR